MGTSLVARSKKFLRNLGPLLSLAFFVAALVVLHHELRAYRYQDILAHLRSLSKGRIFLALLLSGLNYFILTTYDKLAFRYIKHPLRYTKIALVSFIGYAFSHNIGHGFLTSASVRYRLYSSWELSALEITHVVAFCTVTFWLGLLVLAGVVFLAQPFPIPVSFHLPFASLQPLGGIFLMVAAGYLLWCVVTRKGIRIRDWEFSPPSPRQALLQILISVSDWLLSATVVYILLPHSPELPYPTFLRIFLVAQIVALMSQVPGGLGVFETSFLLLLPRSLPASAVFGSLLIYRGIYYFLPLGVAIILLGVHETLDKKENLKKIGGIFGPWVPELIPLTFSFGAFVAGAMLLFSGAIPAVRPRLGILRHFLPLPILEISHFLGSLVGSGLLLLAQGLQRRLDGAYLFTVTLLGMGIIVSLLKGLNYEEAFILGVMLVALIPCRPQFYRKASLTSEQFTVGWIAAIALVVLSSVWLGTFSYKYVEYSDDLWWRFALSEDAPRFLRATVGSLAFILMFGLARLLRPAKMGPTVLTPEDLEKARTIIQSSPRVLAHLALMGDKALLFSENGKAFLMYGIEKRSWIALGDPVGPEEEIPELVWRFRELGDLYNAWTVFYDVPQKHLPIYIDLGLTLIKIGEEGRVPLGTFSLAGGENRKFRYVQNRVEKEGCIFEVIRPESVPSILGELKRVSEVWLSKKNTREKKFSMGFFNETYLNEFPMAVVRRESKIVTFANLLLGAEKEELSVDLMRYAPEAPEDVMEYLFIQAMLWGKEQGYLWFSLGLAPLAGLEGRTLAPVWHRIGALVFDLGEHFYNFQGVRDYKEKFSPVWEPKYLACPGGLAVPRVLTDLASLVAGGLKGIVSK